MWLKRRLAGLYIEQHVMGWYQDVIGSAERGGWNADQWAPTAGAWW